MDIINWIVIYNDRKSIKYLFVHEFLSQPTNIDLKKIWYIYYSNQWNCYLHNFSVKKTLMSEVIVYIIKFKYEQISLPITPGLIQPIKSVFTWQWKQNNYFYLQGATNWLHLRDRFYLFSQLLTWLINQLIIASRRPSDEQFLAYK